MRRQRLMVGVVVAVLMVGGAVVWAVVDSGGGGGSLADTSWTLTELDGAPATEPLPTAAFVDGRASGGGGCNTYSADYTEDGNAISFGPIASTLIACEGAAMEQETVFFAALDGASRYAIDGSTLTISGDAATMVFTAD